MAAPLTAAMKPFWQVPREAPGTLLASAPPEAADERKFLCRFVVFQRIIGQGSYGQVRLVMLPAAAGREARLLAVKVQTIPATGSEDFCQEANIGHSLTAAAKRGGRGHNRVCLPLAHHLGEHFWQDGYARGYIVMPAALGTLRDYLKTRLWTVPALIARQFASDMFEGLLFIHALNIWHRDLKPNNILMMEDGNARLRLKLADFGLSCQSNMSRRDEAMKRTPRVAAPLYRAPELLLAGDTRLAYDGKQVDIWGAGLVVAELLGSFILQQCEDEAAILKELVKRLGNFTEHTWPGVSKQPGFKRAPKTQEQPVGLELDGSSDANDVAQACLQLCPASRPTAEAVLSMSWFVTDDARASAANPSTSGPLIGDALAVPGAAASAFAESHGSEPKGAAAEVREASQPAPADHVTEFPMHDIRRWIVKVPAGSDCSAKRKPESESLESAAHKRLRLRGKVRPPPGLTAPPPADRGSPSEKVSEAAGPQLPQDESTNRLCIASGCSAKALRKQLCYRHQVLRMGQAVHMISCCNDVNILRSLVPLDIHAFLDAKIALRKCRHSDAESHVLEFCLAIIKEPRASRLFAEACKRLPAMFEARDLRLALLKMPGAQTFLQY